MVYVGLLQFTLAAFGWALGYVGLSLWGAALAPFYAVLVALGYLFCPAASRRSRWWPEASWLSVMVCFSAQWMFLSQQFFFGW